ncbi:MAG TPA: TetR family transcriptional regulator [Steroidobacteraceae bacterium]|nr:TetR family transcriptional regulator [Steroidobacteraceae bacterium]
MLFETRKRKPRTPLTRQRVAAAAVERFKRFGVHRTSMNDIADTLGVSRQTIYRLFESRTELLEFIATARVKLLSQKITKLLSQFDNLRDALIEGMAYSVKLGRQDELLSEIIREAGDVHFKTFMFGGTREVQEAMMAAFGPFIRKARAEGTLASPATDQQVIEWLCNNGAVLNIRQDYNEADHRRILEQFVLPSLLRNDR